MMAETRRFTKNGIDRLWRENGINHSMRWSQCDRVLRCVPVCVCMCECLMPSNDRKQNKLVCLWTVLYIGYIYMAILCAIQFMCMWKTRLPGIYYENK